MSGQLAAKDLRTVLDVVHGLHEDTTPGIDLSAYILGRLGRLVGCESTFYSRVRYAGRKLLATSVDPPDMDHSGLPEFHAVFDQHPGFAAYQTGALKLGTAAALTDLADLRTLRRLPFYVDFYQPSGANDQLVFVARSNNHQGSVLAFNRARRGFTQRDRAVVDLVSPHVIQAVKQRQRVASLAAVVARLGRHREELDRARSQLSALTSREREIVELVVHAATDREIARFLGISQRTVHKHLERIYRKLSLTSRAGLITLVHREHSHTLHSTG